MFLQCSPQLFIAAKEGRVEDVLKLLPSQDVDVFSDEVSVCICVHVCAHVCTHTF